MGNMYVTSVATDRLEEAVRALADAGIETAPGTPTTAMCDVEYVCRRRRSQLTIGVCWDGKWPDEAFIVIAYPPYTTRPWRWREDARLFDDVVATLSGYEHRGIRAPEGGP